MTDLLIGEGLEVDELMLFTPSFIKAAMRRTARGVGNDYDGRPIGESGFGGESTVEVERQHAAWIKAHGVARKILEECATQEEIDAAVREYKALAS